MYSQQSRGVIVDIARIGTGTMKLSSDMIYVHL